MHVLAQLDRARAELDVLEHPFYLRWSAGELGPQELACYAGEYRHAVLALAQASASAAGAAGPAHAQLLRAHAEEEEAHVALWDRFADPAAARGRAAGRARGGPHGAPGARGAARQLAPARRCGSGRLVT